MKKPPGSRRRGAKLTRRQLAMSAPALLGARHVGAASGTPQARGDGVSLTSVEGLQVGHATRSDRPTGCTVVIAEEGAVAGVAVRGAAPGTRDIALLEPENTVSRVHAVLLTGGSAFGLAAADGVMRFLRQRGIGFGMGSNVVPIVPAAVLYDLGLGDGTFPEAEHGAAAAAAASTDAPAEGNVGAGAGATVGKLFGMEHAMKGGIGSAGFRFDDGTVVAALVAVNCRGDVRDPQAGRLVAGARTEDGTRLRDAEAVLLDAGTTPRNAGMAASAAGAGSRGFADNTTIGIVATNRTLDKTTCSRLAGVAHDGLARTVVPAHTYLDGDTLFALATGAAAPLGDGERDRLEAAAAAAVSAAILRAVRQAESLPGLPSAAELGTA